LIEKIMEFVDLTNEQIKSITSAKRKTQTITERRTQLLDELARVSSNYRPLVDAGVAIRKLDSDGAGLEIVTVFGNARTSFGWSSEGAELLGTILFERERRDSYGKTYWEPIFGIRIPEFEDPTSSSHADALVIPLDERFSDDFEGSLRRATIAVVYGIINGPVIAKS
jgi:hypothetical protein